MNFRQLLYGLLSVFPWVPESLYRGTGGTNSAEYCYCIWMRHLVLARAQGMSEFPRVVAELGPGDSIGVGLAALISGTERYFAFDALAHADPATHLRIFDELVEMFRRRDPIPGKDRFPEISIDLPSNAFPHSILSPGHMESALDDDRITTLRSIVQRGDWSGNVIQYRVNWLSEERPEREVDFVLSNAVMEHVADPFPVYKATYDWLSSGGYASHQIDFRSHGLFNAWDGHWACPDWLWALFVGRRHYLLNREPLAPHRRLAERAGFEEVVVIRDEKAPQVRRLAPRFRDMSAEDQRTSGAYVLLRKPN